jgi:hypothetical protein
VATAQWATLALGLGEAMSSLIEHEPGEIRYAKSGGVNIAYQVGGAGPVDLVYPTSRRRERMQGLRAFRSRCAGLRE